ncbi:MAG: choice-of-anchor D domain-containing protein [Muribaculaceae bacterium]|nr:choice-of-anchor D domain-containing protein [Muribaculaceae bacterium]
MKKIFLLLAVAFAAFAAQADELTVYNGQDYNNLAPLYGGYYDTPNMACQMIYQAADIEAMQGALITSMKFYVFYPETGNPLNGGKLAVSMGVTDQEQFSGYSPSLITGLTQVAEISMNQGDLEIVVNFDTPFVYQGGNLVVETKVIETESGNYYEDFYFYGKTTDFYASMYRLPSSGSSYGQQFGPKTTFTYQVSDDYATISTSAMDFGKVYPEMEATPQTFTIKNLGKNAFTPVFSTLEAPFSVSPAPAEIAAGESAEYTVTFAPTDLGTYAQTLTINCGAAGQFEIALTGVKADLPDVIPVCDGTDTNGYLPFYGYYYDNVTKGQMIYTADMLLPVAGKKITSVTFYPTAPMTFQGGKLQLSFKAVEQDGFTTYTALTDLTAVATWEPGEEMEVLTFELTEPYEYTGGNLAIEVYNVVKGSNWPNCYFYGQNMTDYTPSFYIYGGSNDRSYFLPKVGFGYVKEDTPEPQGLRGDVNDDKKVDITDATMLINYLLSNDPTGINMENANCDLSENGKVDITDATTLINYLLNNAW